MKHAIRCMMMMAFALTAACQAQPMRIEITDGDRNITFNAPTESRAIQVAVFDRDGALIRGPNLRWFSVNKKIADVSKEGVVIPKAEGQTTVVVRSGYTQRDLPVVVQYYGAIEPSERSVLMQAGEVKALTASVHDMRGKEIDDAPMTWTSLDPSIVEVDENGTLIGLTRGATEVLIRAKHLTTRVPVEITEPTDLPST